jgi:hypothetical protein
MSSYVSAELRRYVAERAGWLCEYCLIHESDAFLVSEVDHIVAVKHGGLTCSENLAYSCAVCNRAKGTDIASLAPETQALTRLFNPRTDHWGEHFRFDPDSSLIESLTEIGRVTARLLGFNDINRILERQALFEIGRYPPAGMIR